MAENFMDNVEAVLKDALGELGLPAEIVTVEQPAQRQHGDYASNAAMVLAKETKSNPRELATKIVQEILKKKPDFLDKVETAGPGFINFSLSKKALIDNLDSIHTKGETYGESPSGKGRTVIVEFSSPNIAKPFTIGHLRSTIIGNAIANLLTFSGHSVLRDNHLGDWGTQFGKQIVAIKRWGDETALDKSENPVRLLVDLYVKFHAEAESDPSLEDEARAWFSKLEKKDPEARRLWQKCVDWSMVEFNALYKRLGVPFDMMLGESFFEDKMDVVLQDLKKKKLAKESEGALLVFFPKDVLPPLMVLKKDGSTLYATRDLATDRYRFNTWGKDIMIVNEVGAEQKLYFRQIFLTEELLGYCKPGQRVHVGHGLVRFKEGKMSTRKGNTIWLEQVLEEAVRRAEAINPKSAEEVGIGAMKYNDLKRETEKDIVFDWDDVLNLKGNSGPYLQYTAVRANSILEKAGVSYKDLSASSDSISLNPEEIAVLRHLARFPEVVRLSAREFAPHHLCTYLFELAQEFNTFYNGHRVIAEDKELMNFRLNLTGAVARVLETGLSLLGIVVPREM